MSSVLITPPNYKIKSITKGRYKHQIFLSYSFQKNKQQLDQNKILTQTDQSLKTPTFILTE